MAMNPLEAARWWIGRRCWPVPVPWMQKGPVVQNWPELRLTLETAPQYFSSNGAPQNIALLMGDPDNLTDIDFDCEEARWAGLEYAPPTGLKWGRKSNPSSHHLYYTDPAASSAKYLDPVFEKERPGDACMIELRCRTKQGKPGYPVVCPPSTHPSGEAYEFTAGSAGAPAKIAGGFLSERVRLIAAASMFGRHAREGARHEIFIALAGTLARAKWDLEEAQRLLRAIYRVLWREGANLKQADADVDSTYQKFDDGGETTGLTRLGELVDERVFKRFKEWLGLEWEDGAARQQPPPRKEPRIWPVQEPIENLRHRVIVKPKDVIDGLIKVPSITLLVSPPKTGKTILLAQMVMSIVNGLHLFDNYVNYFKAGQASGLIIEWDDQQGESSLQDFLLKCRASRADQAIDIVTRPKEAFTISDPEFKPWLISEIRKRPNRIVCGLDSLIALRGFGADDKKRNIVKLEASEITMLGEVSIETQCGLVVNHHDSKSAAALDTFSRAAGTYALTACTEAQIVLGRFPELASDDPARLMSVRGRHIRGMETVLRFCEETLDFDFVLDGAAARYYPELRQLLRGLRGVSFDAKRATHETGWSQAKAYQVLGHLTWAGILIKENASWAWNPSWVKTLEQI